MMTSFHPPFFTSAVFEQPISLVDQELARLKELMEA